MTGAHEEDVEVRLSGTRGAFTLDVAFTVPASGVTAVFGPSGSGKTTLLRCLAGLERLPGTVRFGSRVWQRPDTGEFVPPEARRIGYVFQEAALFPHLTVRQNLVFAWQRAGASRAITVERATEALGVGELLSRAPATLSGGERQRVAIARALAANPVLLLMDEPVAALDVAARASVLTHLLQIRERLAIPIFYVTHAVDEVARLADRVLWLRAGSVHAEGATGAVLARLDVGEQLGEEAGGLIEARVERHDEAYHLTELSTAWGPMLVRRVPARAGATVRLRIRANDVSIGLVAETRSSILNVLPAIVRELSDTSGGETLVRLECPNGGASDLLARITRRSSEDLALTPGKRVFARIKGVSVK